MLMGMGVCLRKRKCPMCGQAPVRRVTRRPSYALAAVFKKALPEVPGGPTAGLRGLHGLPAMLAALPLVEALKALEDPAEADAFDALLPSHGMGSKRGAIETLTELLEACRAFHDWTIEVE